MKEMVARIFKEHRDLQEAFLERNLDVIVAVAGLIIAAVGKRRTVFFFGNGGSAADAQHLAAELVNRFRANRRALPAVALTTDTSVLTSIANDSSYNQVFARQVEALGRAGDVAVGLSTSGASPNVIEGLRTARREGLATVAFTGGEGGSLPVEVDHCILVPSSNTPRVQEMHIVAGHAICLLVEQAVMHEAGRAP